MVRRPGHRALWLAVILTGAAARADWQSEPLPVGTPNDLNFMDAGVVVIGHSQGLVAAYAAPGQAMALGTQISDAGAMVGGRLGAGNCLYGLRAAQYDLVSSAPGCGVPESSLSTTGLLFRTAPSGAGWLAYSDGTSLSVNYHVDAGAAGLWVTNTTIGTTTTALHFASTTAAGVDWAALHVGGVVFNVLRPGAGRVGRPATGVVADLDAFEHGSAPAVLIAIADGGLALNPDFSDAGTASARVAQPPSDLIVAVAFTELGGDAFGRGVGFALSDAGVWSPIPNPAAPAQVWVRRADAPIPDPLLVRCLDSANCVALSALPGSPQAVSWYFNRFPPEWADGGTWRLAADAGTTVRVTAPIIDRDGDPLWVTWAAGANGLTVTPVGGAARSNEQADLAVPSAVACGLNALPFDFRASDGWSPHTTPLTGFVDVVRNEPPGPPVLSSNSVTLFAGLGPQFVGYGAPTTGCPATGGGAVPSGTGFTATPVDGGYLFTPDPTFCSTDGGGALTVTATNDAGSSVATVAVSVVPWGAPTIGAFTPGPAVELDAGSALSLGLSASHACQGAGDFPGFDYLYSVDGGGPTVTVTRSPDGGFTVTSTDACAAAQLSIAARAVVRGEDAGRVSAGTASVAISVVPNFPPLTPDQFDAGIEYDPARNLAHGETSLTAACAAQRGLDARIAVYGSAGAVISGPKRVAIPDLWELEVPGGCSGGDFFVKAELMSGATPTGIEQLESITTTFRPAGAASVSPSEALVRCGDAVGLTVTAEPIPNACGSQEYLWRQVSGPPVTLQNASGRQIDVASVAEFDALGGATIELEVSTDAGLGNIGRPVRQAIVLQPAPFVGLAHSFEPLPALEGEAVPVRATLSNTSGCDVTGLVLREQLGRLRYVEGSARVNGARALATVTDGAVEIGPVDLSAGRSAHVTWLARAPLESALRVQGAVLMRGAPVTLPPPEPLPAAACGCGSAPWVGSAALLALLRLLAGQRKRRR